MYHLNKHCRTTVSRALLCFAFIAIIDQVNGQQEFTQEQQQQQPTATNETGYLSDLWSSLTTVGKTASCPGECLHAITSIFCDSVLEEISCGEPYLRCCVSQTVTYTATPVETSPPFTSTDSSASGLGEILSVISNNHNSSQIITTVQPSPDLVMHITTTTSSPLTSTNTQLPFSSASNSDSTIIPTTTTLPATDLHYNNPLIINGSSPSESVLESGRDSSSTSCPVECTRVSPNAFCVRAIRDAVCGDPEEECCLEREPANDQVDQLTKNLIKLVQQSVALNETKNIGSELLLNSPISPTNPPTTTQSPLPACDGTCVISLFSLLCDEVDSNQYCPNGGSCCVNREQTTSTPQIGPCDGNCIPVVLSGMCNKPFELVLKTVDCVSGTICCADRKGEGSENQQTSSSSQEDVNNGEMMPVDGDINSPPLHHLPIAPQYTSRLPVRPIHPPSHLPPGHYSQYGNSPNGYIPKPNSNLMPIPPMQPIPAKPNKQTQYLGHRKPQSPVVPQVEPEHNTFIGPQMAPDSHYIRPNHVVENFDQKPALAEPELKPPVPHKSKPFPSNETPLFPCPGNCMAPMFRFACLGSNSIYPKFHCPKGQLCCAPGSEIDKFEAFLQQAAATSHSVQPSHPPQSPVIINSNIPAVKPVLHPKQHPKQHPNQQHQHQPSPDLQPLKPIPVPPVDSSIVLTEPTSSPHVCGVKGSKSKNGLRGQRVVGADSYPGEWCWQVALMNAKNNYICGGALIDRQWLLTAAHCVANLLRKNEAIYVRAGEYDLKRSNKVGIKVATTYVHHNHNGQTLDNDIALLKLQSPVELNAETCLVCLPTSRTIDRGPGKRCTVTGYGFQHESGPVALRVRQASLPVVDDENCTSRINNVTERLFILPVNSFCAGGELANDACNGDGGSGLVCQSDGFYELTGLVSWGFGCGRSGVPGVYAKVSSFVGWINQIVSTNSN